MEKEKSLGQLANPFPFSALTLLVGRQEGHPACKWVCGSELKERKRNAEIRECVGLLVVMI